MKRNVVLMIIIVLLSCFVKDTAGAEKKPTIVDDPVIILLRLISNENAFSQKKKQLIKLQTDIEDNATAVTKKYPKDLKLRNFLATSFYFEAIKKEKSKKYDVKERNAYMNGLAAAAGKLEPTVGRFFTDRIGRNNPDKGDFSKIYLSHNQDQAYLDILIKTLKKNTKKGEDPVAEECIVRYNQSALIKVKKEAIGAKGEYKKALTRIQGKIVASLPKPKPEPTPKPKEEKKQKKSAIDKARDALKKFKF